MTATKNSTLSGYRLEDVVVRAGGYWALKVPNGFELYREGVTHSTRCAVIDYEGETGLRKLRDELTRRIEVDRASAAVGALRVNPAFEEAGEKTFAFGAQTRDEMARLDAEELGDAARAYAALFPPVAVPAAADQQARDGFEALRKRAGQRGLHVEGDDILFSEDQAAKDALVCVDRWLFWRDGAIRMEARVLMRDSAQGDWNTAAEGVVSESLTQRQAEQLVEHWAVISREGSGRARTAARQEAEVSRTFAPRPQTEEPAEPDHFAELVESAHASGLLVEGDEILFSEYQGLEAQVCVDRWLFCRDGVISMQMRAIGLVDQETGNWDTLFEGPVSEPLTIGQAQQLVAHWATLEIAAVKRSQVSEIEERARFDAFGPRPVAQRERA